MSNLAPAVAAAFGPENLAGSTVIDRIMQFTFDAFFALPGVIAPEIGQNLGALRPCSVNCSLGCRTRPRFWGHWSLLLTASSGLISTIVHLTLAAHDLVMFFCWTGGAVWTLIGLQLVALPTFNVLRRPLFYAAANWSRATIGTVPLVQFGAFY